MAPSEPAKLFSFSAYARHRGCSIPTVSKAVRKGRLKRSIQLDHEGNPKITDFALADQEWEASQDHTTTPPAVLEALEASAAASSARTPPANPGAPPPLPRASGRGRADDDVSDLLGEEIADPPDDLESGEEMSLSRASAIEKQWRAKLVRLEYRKKAGELVEAAEVAAKLTDTFTICRNKLLGLPTRVRQRIPGLSTADVLIIDGLVREALEELSNAAESLG